MFVTSYYERVNNKGAGIMDSTAHLNNKIVSLLFSGIFRTNKELLI